MNNVWPTNENNITLLTTLFTDGFIYVEDVLAHPQFCSYSLEDIQRVVSTNDKQRFKLCSHPVDGRLQIRANQGHSVQVRYSSRAQMKENTQGHQ